MSPDAEALALVQQEADANARLIADLIWTLKCQACHVCDRCLGDPPSRSRCSFCAPARAVIARAEGR